MSDYVPKKYVYKAYSGTNYLGDLPNVTSDFYYSALLNSAGASLTVVLGNRFEDVGAVQTDVFWVDEADNRTVDGKGNRIVMRKRLDFLNIPIDLANRIKVYMYDNNYPNGLIVFDGLISKWNTSYKNNMISITVLSFGIQLNNLLVSSTSATTIVDQEIENNTRTVGTTATLTQQYAQSFTLAAPAVIGSFKVFCYRVGGNNAPINWQMYSGTPLSPGSLIDSGGINPPLVNSAGLQPFNLTTAVSLPAGNYFILLSGEISGTDSGIPFIGSDTGASYAGGKLYYRDLHTTSTWTDTTEDLTFTINISDGSQILNFASIDPGQIARTFMDQIISQGAIPSYTTDTIDLTGGTPASYDFKIATGLEGLNKSLSLAPAGWYWYYDLAANLVHFHSVDQTAAHILSLGTHFADLDITYSLEQMINTVVFSGGDTGGGINLFSIYTGPTSISKYGKWLELLSDNRVTVQATADAIGNGELAAKQDPSFLISVQVTAASYDIETFVQGQMVALKNTNTLIDTINYQIVGCQRFKDSVILNLGNVPPRASQSLNDINRRLDAIDTINNPAVPS